MGTQHTLGTLLFLYSTYTLGYNFYMILTVQWRHPTACVFKLYFDYLSLPYDLLIAFHLT